MCSNVVLPVGDQWHKTDFGEGCLLSRTCRSSVQRELFVRLGCSVVHVHAGEAGFQAHFQIPFQRHCSAVLSYYIDLALLTRSPTSLSCVCLSLSLSVSIIYLVFQRYPSTGLNWTGLKLNGPTVRAAKTLAGRAPVRAQPSCRAVQVHA